jgi:hypothetical protein
MKNFSHLGTGIYFYFFYLKYLVFIFTILLVLLSIPTMIISRKYNSQMISYCNNTSIVKDDDKMCKEFMDRDNDWLYSMNCDNLRYYKEYLVETPAFKSNIVDYSFIVFITLMVIWVVKHVLVVIVNALDLEIDMLNITPSDYALMISNIPQTIENKDAIVEEYLNIHNAKGKNGFEMDIKPVEVNLTYRISDFVKTKNEFLKLKKLIKHLELKKLTTFKPWVGKPMTLDELRAQLNMNSKRLNEYILNIDKPEKKLFTGVVFATFNTSEEYDKFLNEFPNTHLKYFIALLQYLTASFLCCCCFDKKKLRKYKNKLILSVIPAPEPTEILWENLEVSYVEGVIRTLIVYFITLLLLAVSFGIILGLNIAQTGLPDDLNTYKYALSALISITISVVNALAVKLINVLTDYERKISITTKYLSNSVKLQAVCFVY